MAQIFGLYRTKLFDCLLHVRRYAEREQGRVKLTQKLLID